MVFRKLPSAQAGLLHGMASLKVDPLSVIRFQTKVNRSLERTYRENSMVQLSARCVILQTAIDTFCTKCKYGEDGIRAISHRIKTCVNGECPLHPVRTGTKGTSALSTMVNVQLEVQKYGKPKKIGWTNEEDQDLLNRTAKHHNLRRIALETNRSFDDVRERLKMIRKMLKAEKLLK